MLRVGTARAEREARDRGLLRAAADCGRHVGAPARLHQPRVLPEASGALALPARVRAVGGLDGVLRDSGSTQRARHARQARERRRDAAGQDHVHHRDHQSSPVRTQDAEPVGRGSYIRYVVPRHPAVSIQDTLQFVGSSADHCR